MGKDEGIYPKESSLDYQLSVLLHSKTLSRGELLEVITVLHQHSKKRTGTN